MRSQKAPNQRLLLPVRVGQPPDDQLTWRGRRAPQQKRDALGSAESTDR